MSAQEDLERLAREAGAAGIGYDAWASSNATFDLVSKCDEETPRGADGSKCEAAFREGRREHRARSWASVWTTAPEGYDQFGTETAEGPFPWEGKQLRRVLVDPAQLPFQLGRYGSGMHGDWKEDPRVTEARVAEAVARERSERELREVRRKGGILWLREVTDGFLALESSEDSVDAELRARGLTWVDWRGETARREKERAAAERAATWARCRAAFEDGATLVDDGAPSKVVEVHGLAFRHPGREPRVWHSVLVVPHYAVADDAEEARVVERTWGKYAAKDEYVGSLANVAERLAKGELRLARPDEKLPPRAVIDRFGQPHTEILRVEYGALVAWVARLTFSCDPVVLDDRGHLVRFKALREAGLRAYREKLFGGRS